MRSIRIGHVYNLRRIENSIESNTDVEAEFNTLETVSAIKEAILSLGHEVVELEANKDLPQALINGKIDIVFNTAEGSHGRTRESQVPAVLEFLGITYSGSDSTTIALCHDKVLAKLIVSQLGLLTPTFFTLITGKEKLPSRLNFPLILKPAYEGSSKGIHESSVVHSENELREHANELINRYKQPFLVENFLPGREFTIGLLGEKNPRPMLIEEIVFIDEKKKHPVYSFTSKFSSIDVKNQVPALIDADLRRKLIGLARRCFYALGCRDYARIDIRLDDNGEPFFIECNPIPGITPDFSDLCLMAKADGMSYQTLIGKMLAPAIRRYKNKIKQQMYEEK